MSCFLVPLAQAVATSVYRKHNAKAIADPASPVLKRHIPALEKMLWGGSIVLIVDHIIHGELTWRFPFFTGLDQVGGGSAMLHEILTVGVPMSLILTAIWAVYAVIKDKRSAQPSKA